MKIRSIIGKKILEHSSSYQFYSQRYNLLIKNEEKHTKIIDTLKKRSEYKNQIIRKIDKEHKEEINEKNRQIQELNETNQQLTEKITLNSEELNQIKEKITLKNEELNQIKEKISLSEKSANEILNLLKNDEKKLQLHFLEKKLNYLNIRLSSKFNEHERFLTSNMDIIDKKIKNYLITIVIPAYNVENYLERCFLSILRQSIGFNNLEIIFVDDCSTDNSYNMLREYAINYPNVRVYKTDKNSRSPGKPRNVGMKYATSDYIMFFDADDILHEDSCEILYNKIIESNASLVSGMHNQINPDNRTVVSMGLYLSTFTDSTHSLDERKKEFDKIDKKDLEEVIIDDINDYPYVLGNFHLGSKLFNLKFLRDNHINLPEYVLGEDSLFLYKSLVSAKKIVFINKIIYTYDSSRRKIGNKSLSHDLDVDLQLTRIKCYNEIMNFSKQKDVEEITFKQLLCEKMQYFFKTFVINKNLSDDNLIRIFNETKQLCELLIKYDAVTLVDLKEIYSKIINDEYDEAMLLCR